jgi:hypothetical protein
LPSKHRPAQAEREPEDDLHFVWRTYCISCSFIGAKNPMSSLWKKRYSLNAGMNSGNYQSNRQAR